MRIAAFTLGSLCLSAGIGLGYLALPAPTAVAAAPARLALAPAAVPAPYSAASHDVRRQRPKPGLDVRVMGPPRYYLGEGMDRRLELTLSTGSLQGLLRVEVSGSAGLMVLNQTEYEFDLSASRRVSLPVWVLGSAPGEHLLNIIATDASGQRRSSAVAVQVGSDAIIAQARIDGAAQAVAKGEIALPAQEVIK